MKAVAVRNFFKGAWFLFLFLGLAFSGKAQDRPAQLYSHLHKVDSTDMVVATVETNNKWTMGLPDDTGLVFINTRTLQTTTLEMPASFMIHRTVLNVPLRYHQEKPILVSAKFGDWNKKDKLEWEDPNYLFIVTSTGKHLKQISPENASVVDWVAQPTSNTITIIAKTDNNGDKKFDAKDPNKLYVFHLGTGRLTEVTPK